MNLQKGGDEVPKRICKYIGCNELIDKSEVYCEKHKQKVEARRKESYKFYDYNRKDSKEWNFYRTGEWEKLRDDLLDKYNHIDIYIYYTENRIVKANTAHHIIEVKEDWDKRLDIDNLFPMTDGSHTTIHIMYKDDKYNTQCMLRELLKKFIDEFGMDENGIPPYS